jgi:3-isopropylmalate/(R)-2-methylmalate dehydratase large subunit
MTKPGGPRTLYDKIWDRHVVRTHEDGRAILYIDRHFIHEVTSPQAFESLRSAGRSVRRPEATLAVADHNLSTLSGRTAESGEEDGRLQLRLLRESCEHHGITYYGPSHTRQGIVHVIGPELGLSQPGMTIACGDSHTPTQGAVGAYAIGIGTSEVEHILATQTIVQRKARNMRITVAGELPLGVTPKDMVMAIIGQIGFAGGTGHVIEFAGKAIHNLSMEGRLTISSMAIEAGARSGLIAPDQTTFDYLRDRPFAPSKAEWDAALEFWSQFASDNDAGYDREVRFSANQVVPMVTWGTNPGDVVGVTERVPDPTTASTEESRAAISAAIDYMGLRPNQLISEIRLDRVFIGSCTNGRIEDLRQAARVVQGRTVAGHIAALVVPGSSMIKQQAEQEGLADIFRQAGFEWRESGCSMCIGLNADRLAPQERCASTSNRNFEGRQGDFGRTHLVSPAMAAAAAIAGHFVDVRSWNGAQ